MPREAHEAMREISIKEQKSIVAVIFDATDPRLTACLIETQHMQCLEWLSAQLSARDRDEITKVLCKSQPDFLTAAVRGAVATYEPFIRAIHESMDLREHVTAAETFLADFIETSKPKQVKGGWRLKNGKAKAQDTRPPSVEDYVALIRRNKGLLYKYCHQFAKSCVDLREQFRGWAHLAIDEFRQQHGTGGGGATSGKLQEMYAALPPETRSTVLASLDAHAAYLGKLDTLSNLRMQRVLDQLDSNEEKSGSGGSSKSSSKSSSPRVSSGGPSMSGPGVYLMRWDALLDETLITPVLPHGPVRRGRDVKGQKAGGKTVAEGVKGGWDAGALAKEEDKVVPEAPDVALVMELLGAQFRLMVNEKIGEVGPSLEQAGYEMNEREGEELVNGVDGIVLA